MNLRTELVRLKVERAEKHIIELQADVQGFYDTKPYVAKAEREPQTRMLVYRLAVCSEPPDRFSLITGDVLQNLRSALDHLIWQLVEVAGNIPHRATSFPICENLTEYQSHGTARKINGISKLATKALDAAKPYRGGNDTLWKLHRLNNVDKHRLLITVGGAFRHLDLWPIMRKTITDRRKDDLMAAHIASLDFHIPMRPADSLFPLKQGDELFRDVPDAEWNPDIKFGFEIAFGEPGVAEGEPLLPTLRAMRDLVGNLISDFDPLLA